MISGASFSHLGRTLLLHANHPAVYHVALSAFADIAREALERHDHHAEIKIGEQDLEIGFDGTHARSAARFIDGDSSSLTAFYATSGVFARFAAASRSHFALYAAAVQLAAGAVVIAGPTTVGKTVLALHLAARGARIYGDELILLDRSACTIEAFPRRLLLREPSLPLLPNDAMRKACLQSRDAIDCSGGRLWYALDPDALCGRGVRACASPLAGVILIDGRARRSSIERVAPMLGAIELARRTFRNERGLAELKAFCEIGSSVPVYRMLLGAPAEGASYIEAAFGPCT
ncbi:MAG: hypothetical protein ACXVAO_05420 [Vulcanimicrobiaceae bacterium]